MENAEADSGNKDVDVDNEENKEEHEAFLVESGETNVEQTSEDKHDKEDLEKFPVEPRDNEDARKEGIEGAEEGSEIVQVKLKEKCGEREAKDEEEYLFGEEEIWEKYVEHEKNCSIGDKENGMEKENMCGVYLCQERKRHFIKENKVREMKGVRENVLKSGELKKKIVPKPKREAVSRFKEKANE